MSSYADANASYRRAKYRARPMAPAKALGLKVAAGATILVALGLGFTGVAYGGGRTGSEQLVVTSGQTLWSIAQDRYPDDDTRTMVSRIVEMNRLGNKPLYVGEKLVVPAR